jgi:lipid-binding SYLF domain-containing protein
VKKFKLVWVFEQQKDVTKFVNSDWELGGQTSAAAKLGDESGAVASAVSISPGV